MDFSVVCRGLRSATRHRDSSHPWENYAALCGRADTLRGKPPRSYEAGFCYIQLVRSIRIKHSTGVAYSYCSFLWSLLSLLARVTTTVHPLLHRHLQVELRLAPIRSPKPQGPVSTSITMCPGRTPGFMERAMGIEIIATWFFKDLQSRARTNLEGLGSLRNPYCRLDAALLP